MERAAELERLQRFEEALVLYHRARLLRAEPPPPALSAALAEGVLRAEGGVRDGMAGIGLLADALPGMIEQQREARGRARLAARNATERRRALVHAMEFADSGRGPPADQDDHDADHGLLQVVALRHDQDLDDHHDDDHHDDDGGGRVLAVKPTHSSGD